MAFSNGYKYRKKISISNGGSALTDYQLQVAADPDGLTTGLVGAWNMNISGSITTVAYDSSENSNHMNFVGTPTLTAGGPGNRKYMALNATTEYPMAANFQNFPSGDLSAAFWIRTTDTNFAVMGYEPTGSANIFLLYDPNGSGLHLYRGGVENWLGSGADINDGNWHHCVVTWKQSGGNWAFYRDGVLTDTGSVGSGTSAPAGGTFMLGQEQDTPGVVDPVQALTGDLADVRLWSRVLSQSEITELYTRSIIRYDYRDVIFVDSAGNSLNYWREHDGKWWVKVPSVPAGSSYIYMYFGNPTDDTEKSNGDNTFIFFDDFKASTSINTSKWTATGAASISAAGMLDVTTGALYSDNHVGNMTNKLAEMKITWWGPLSGGYGGLSLLGGSNSTAPATIDKLFHMSETGGSNNVHGWGAIGTNASYNVVSGVFQWTKAQESHYILGSAVRNGQLQFYRNRTQINAYAYGGSWSTNTYLSVGEFRGSGAGTIDIQNVAIDWILVRQVPNTTPTNSVGATQQAGIYVKQAGAWVFKPVNRKVSGVFTDKGEKIRVGGAFIESAG